jgi:lipopolysaccharide transport system ATP-binding protein
MSNTVITAENLSKSYLIGHQSAERERYTALRDVIVREARNFARKAFDFVRGRQIVQGYEVEEFWALKDVSFEVKQGEVLGIIGRNGAGKSTLLKILSRITEPTQGRAILRGRVASLLEVGTGFHPELTGRENIFLNGAILGMTRAEIARKFDEIVAFAEVEQFLDTPVKRYSNGMYVRLAFAVAAHLEPEILVVDEVLAVGDAEFQRKCLGKMSDVARGGRTVLFVSHNLSTVQTLCQRAIYLAAGKIVKDSDARTAVRVYMEASSGIATLVWRAKDQKTCSRAAITELSLRSASGSPVAEVVMGDEVYIEWNANFFEEVPDPHFGILIHSTDGVPFLDLRTRHTGLELKNAKGSLRVIAKVDSIGLYPGDYLISSWISTATNDDIDWVQYGLKFTVLPASGPYGDMRLNLNWGKYYVPARWSVREIPSNIN